MACAVVPVVVEAWLPVIQLCSWAVRAPAPRWIITVQRTGMCIVHGGTAVGLHMPASKGCLNQNGYSTRHTLFRNVVGGYRWQKLERHDAVYYVFHTHQFVVAAVLSSVGGLYLVPGTLSPNPGESAGWANKSATCLQVAQSVSFEILVTS